MKTPIPVYDICSLAQANSGPQDFFTERFGDYVKRHPHSLHHPHRHSFYHLVLFTKGAGSHTIDFNKFPVKPFQIYFMIPGQVHSWNFTKEPDGYLVNFSDALFRSFLLNSAYLDRFPFFNGVSEEGVCILPANAIAKVTGYFEALLTEIATTRKTDADMIRVLLLQLFLTVERACYSVAARKVPEQKQLLLNNFRRLIDQYYRTIRLPKEYADLLYVTPNHLNALCVSLVGKTAGELIRDRILLEAKRLLTGTDTGIAEIAYDLSFKDNSYFTRFFRKYEGVTPEEFRKQMRKEVQTA